MTYQPDKNYHVEIALADESKDTFTLTGADVVKLREKIWQQGYVRSDRTNKEVTHWISPFLISNVRVTEKIKK